MSWFRGCFIVLPGWFVSYGHVPKRAATTNKMDGFYEQCYNFELRMIYDHLHCCVICSGVGSGAFMDEVELSLKWFSVWTEKNEAVHVQCNCICRPDRCGFGIFRSELLVRPSLLSFLRCLCLAWDSAQVNTMSSVNESKLKTRTKLVWLVDLDGSWDVQEFFFFLFFF